MLGLHCSNLVLKDLLDTIPNDLKPNATAHLVYDESAPIPPTPMIDAFEPFDDVTLIPLDKEALLENPARSINLTVDMNNLGDGAN